MEWCQIGLYDVWGIDTLRDMEEYFGSKRAHWAWSCVSVWRMGNGQLINVWKDQGLPTPITLKGIKPHCIPQCKSLFLSQLVHGIKNLLMKSSCQEMLPL